MQFVPTPWFLIPDDDTVLGPDGRCVPAAFLRPADPALLSTMALRCAYTDEEIMTRAIIVLVENLPGRMEPV